MLKHARFTSAFLLAGLAASGCDPSLPPETDPTQGREVLIQVLEAWKSGTSLENFRKSHSIVAWDPDWESGAELRAYEISPNDRRIGVDLLVSVTLTLQGKDGTTRTRNANYAVGIGPQTVVLRQVGG